MNATNAMKKNLLRLGQLYRKSLIFTIPLGAFATTSYLLLNEEYYKKRVPGVIKGTDIIVGHFLNLYCGLFGGALMGAVWPATVCWVMFFRKSCGVCGIQGHTDTLCRGRIWCEKCNQRHKKCSAIHAFIASYNP